MNDNVAIVGSSTFGTTLGIILGRSGYRVSILTRTPEEAEDLNLHRQHRRFLPDIPFPPPLAASADAAAAIAPAGLVIFAVPSDRMRANLRAVEPHLTPGMAVLCVAKGLETPGSRRMSQVMEEELPPAMHPRICVMSGPNLAKEIVQGKASSTVIASHSPETLAQVQETMMSATFRVYTSDDIVGVELGGALKNIIALGAGIADGLGLGDNAKAALITRGLAEILRLSVAAGAMPLTLAGLSGLGDVIATCASRLSRNRYVGEQLALGKTWPQIRESMDNVAEGVNTTVAALALARSLDVEMPIAEVTHRVLFEDLPPPEAITHLMRRPPRPEW